MEAGTNRGEKMSYDKTDLFESRDAGESPEGARGR
jgi:hypothetical protein